MALTGIEERVIAMIGAKKAGLVRDLELLVGLPTGCGNKPALDETRERLCARLRALGADVELTPGIPSPDWLYGASAARIPPPTAICRRAASSGRRVLLSGHLDTVHDPHGVFRSLSIRPDGKVATGPGCVDMKGGLVIALAALETLADAGVDVRWAFVLNSDEETGSYNSEAALRTAAGEADIGFVFEPALADGGLVIERPGSGQFFLEIKGRSAHVGRDFASGVSAVTALATQIARVAQLAAPQNGRIVNIGPIDGGHATNVVPDRARAWGNVRFASQEAARELEREVRALETDASALPSVRVQTSFNRPAKPCTPAVKQLAELARGVASDLGQSLPFGKTGGVCDGNILQDAGLPVLDTLGVRGGGLHTSEEWIELESLVDRCRLAAVTIMRASQY